MIDPACKVKSVINEAFNNATMLCEDYYDCAPEINIKGKVLLKDVLLFISERFHYLRASFDQRKEQVIMLLHITPI